MEVVTARLAIELTALGQSVDVVCLEETGPLEDELRAAGLPVHLIRTPGIRTNLAPRHLAEWLASTHPDVVLTNSGVWPGITPICPSVVVSSTNHGFGRRCSPSAVTISTCHSRGAGDK